MRRVVTEAEYTNRCVLTALVAVVQNNPGRRRAKLMRALEGAGHRTRSPLEDRFLAFVERWGVDEPESAVWIEATKSTS